jgi:hypothetical protein
LQIGDVIGTEPTLQINPSGPLTAQVGSQVTFNVQATDVDPGATVTLNGAGIPAGSAMTPSLPVTRSSTVNSTFTWVPTAIQAGTHVLLFSATDNNNQQTLKSITITVITQAPSGPRGIQVKPDQTGLIDGKTKYLGSDPLSALVKPVVSTTDIFNGSRPLHFWLEVKTYTTGKATFDYGPGTSGALAKKHLIAPSLSPTYLVTLPNVDDSLTITANVTLQSTALTMFDIVITNWFRSPLDMDGVVQALDDPAFLIPFYKAIKEFDPFPRTPLGLFQASLRARAVLVGMNGADFDALRKAVKTITGKNIKRKDFVNILANYAIVKTLLETISDEIVYNVRTKGQGVSVSFIASPLIIPDSPDF